MVYGCRSHRKIAGEGGRRSSSLQSALANPPAIRPDDGDISKWRKERHVEMVDMTKYRKKADARCTSSPIRETELRGEMMAIERYRNWLCPAHPQRSRVLRQ